MFGLQRAMLAMLGLARTVTSEGPSNLLHTNKTHGPYSRNLPNTLAVSVTYGGGVVDDTPYGVTPSLTNKGKQNWNPGFDTVYHGKWDDTITSEIHESFFKIGMDLDSDIEHNQEYYKQYYERLKTQLDAGNIVLVTIGADKKIQEISNFVKEDYKDLKNKCYRMLINDKPIFMEDNQLKLAKIFNNGAEMLLSLGTKNKALKEYFDDLQNDRRDLNDPKEMALLHEALSVGIPAFDRAAYIYNGSYKSDPHKPLPTKFVEKVIHALPSPISDSAKRGMSHKLYSGNVEEIKQVTGEIKKFLDTAKYITNLTYNKNEQYISSAGVVHLRFSYDKQYLQSLEDKYKEPNHIGMGIA